MSGTKCSRMNGVLGAVLSLALALPNWVGLCAADTLYWGAGTADIADNTPLPTALNALGGTWNLTTRNWSVDTAGSSYQAWPASGEANVACFGFGLTSDATPAPTITLGSSLAANRIELADPVNTADRGPYRLTATSPVVLTLNGLDPTILVSGGLNFRAELLANVHLAGTAGLRSTGSRALTLFGDASGLTGTVRFDSMGLNFAPGSSLGSTRLQLASSIDGALTLQSASGANNTAFSDDAVIECWHDRSILSLRAWAGETASTETLRQIVLSSGFMNLDAANRSGGSGVNGQFILAHPTDGIDRGPYGKGMIYLQTQNDGEVRTDVVVQNGIPASTILPWGLSGQARLVQLDANKVLKAYINTDVPSNDPNAWLAGQDYRMTAAPTVPLNNSLTLNSLTAYYAGLNPGTLTLADGKTLTLTRGLIGVQRTGGTVELRLSGGMVTTPADTLYLNTGGQACGLGIYSRLEGTFDVVCGGSSSFTVLGGSAPNTFNGTTYVQGGTVRFQKTAGNTPALPGDLVVVSGIAQVHSSAVDQQFAATANITVEPLGTLNQGKTQTYSGVLTLKSRADLGGALFTWPNAQQTFNKPGTGLVFNGGFIRQNSAAQGQLSLLTDVSYAASSELQALFQYYDAAATLQMIELCNTSGTHTRTFAVEDSTTLQPGVPEMHSFIPLGQSSGTAAVRKTGSGMLTFVGLTYPLFGEHRVEAGQLVSGSYAVAAVRNGTLVNNLQVVTGLSTTAGLRSGQRVTGTGIRADTMIATVDGASQVTLTKTASANGVSSLTFTGVPGLVRTTVQTGTITSGSRVITDLATTEGLVVGQPVPAIAGFWHATIWSIDSATQITISRIADQSGTRTITFTGGSALGRGPARASGSGTLMGQGVFGAITIESGGTLDAGLAPDTVGTFEAGTSLVIENGGTLTVDLGGNDVNDMYVVYGDVTLGGDVVPNPVGGYTDPASGEWTIMSYTGTASGSLTAPAGYSVRIDADNQRVLLNKVPSGTLILVR